MFSAWTRANPTSVAHNYVYGRDMSGAGADWVCANNTEDRRKTTDYSQVSSTGPRNPGELPGDCLWEPRARPRDAQTRCTCKETQEWRKTIVCGKSGGLNAYFTLLLLNVPCAGEDLGPPVWDYKDTNWTALCWGGTGQKHFLWTEELDAF